MIPSPKILRKNNAFLVGKQTAISLKNPIYTKCAIFLGHI